MKTSEEKTLELIAELTAYRSTCNFLIKMLNASLVGHHEPRRTLIIEEIENQFTLRRSEWLHPATMELSPEHQAIANIAMQDTLKSLSDYISKKLREKPETNND